jgi:hypothetical protein
VAERVRRPRRKGRSVLFIVGVIAGVLLLGCGGLGALCYVLFIHETEEPVTAADRELVITAERLAQFVPTLHPDPSRGTLRKVRHFDGSREITYEYETPEGADEPLYVNFLVGLERNAQDATYSYTGQKIGTKIGMRLEGGGHLQEVDRNDLWHWGDDSRCALLTNGGKPVGNVFMARKGSRYFSLMIVGVYFQEAGPIRELLGPMLQRLDNYTP